MKKIVLLTFTLILFSTAVVVRLINPVVSYPKETKLLMEVDLPVHNIDSGKNFSTIQEAINDNETLDGHTILVDAGTYYEHVVVNKSISLIGEDTATTIVDGGGIGNVTEVKVDNVTIEGFTIEDSGTSWPNGGITLGNAKNCFISGNIATGNRRGIALFGASNNSISGNILTNNLEGIVLSKSSNNTVSGNKITGSHIGFSCGNSFNNEILRNNITNNKDFGIELWFSSKNVIQENNITENTENGIQLVMSFNNTLRGNRIANSKCNFHVCGNLTELVNDVDTSNTVDGKPIYYWVNERDRALPSDAGCVVLVNCTNIKVENLALKNNWAGVLLACTTNSTITKNNITNNGCGISFGNSSNNNISGNNITNNSGAGIVLSDSSNNNISGNNIINNSCVVGLCEASDNRFYHNNFIENMGPIVVPIGDYEPSKNVWDNGYPSGGNYWSNYNGTDSNQDGIGDSPYTLDANNQDNYPLMGMFYDFAVEIELGQICQVYVISNSTVSNLEVLVWLTSANEYLQPGDEFIRYVVDGEEGSVGFCRIMIPRVVLNDSYVVLVDWHEVSATELPFSNSTLAYLYFTYNHPTQEVVIVPEFPTWTSTLLILIVLTIAIVIYKRRPLKTLMK